MRTENSFEILSDDAFAHLGQDNIAYIRPATIDGGQYFILKSAAGQDILVADNRATALAAAYERGLIVLNVH